MAIGVAIIGSGIFAREEHLPAVQACPHLTLKAIYSRSLKSAKALSESAGPVDLYSNDHSGKTYHDLLLRSDIHGVIIALPIANQPEFIEAALKAGKHVLSEKPVAENIKSAQHLLEFYHTQVDKTKATWGVAENFRFRDSFKYAAQEVLRLGRILGFQVKVFTFVKAGDKWHETDWRKNPTHQGGFVLDGGVHFTAATRVLLGRCDTPTALSAYTTLLHKHLTPVDSVNSIWLTKSGISGTVAMSWGTTFSGVEFNVACEKGTVTIADTKVICVETDGKAAEKDFVEDGSGVQQEVAAWADSIVAGKPNPLQAPEEGLADLELLEMMLKSGENQGRSETLQFQI